MIANFKTLFITILIFGLSGNSYATDIKDLLILADGEQMHAINGFVPKTTEIKKIIIDAGHGGHDGGCHGKLFNEKDLSLKMALKLGSLIRTRFQDVEVIYTRTKDVFIPLHERIGLANKEKADLFISIHCNWISNPKTKGTETFVMGLHRADDNLEVAKRENSAILLEADFDKNYEGYDPNSPVGHIMLTMYQDTYLSQSIDFASHVEKYLKGRNFTSSRGVKQAGFAVLRRATMPSVLVETGFLSNEDEERTLGSEEGQDQVAYSILNAIIEIKEGSNAPRPTEQIAKIKPSETNGEIVQNTKPAKELIKEEISTTDSKMEVGKVVSRVKNKPSAPPPNTSINMPPKKNLEETLVDETPISKDTKPIAKSEPSSEIAVVVDQKYRVQIAALKKNIKSQLEGDRNLNQLGMVIVLHRDDLYKYQIGEFDSLAEASKAKEQLIAMGYKNAFLTTSR